MRQAGLFTGALVFAFSFFVSASSWATSPAQEAARRAYIDRCGASLHAQGLPEEKAQGYCRCIIDGQTKEFRTEEEWTTMMRSEPNPKGSEIAQRLYGVFLNCQHWLSN